MGSAARWDNSIFFIIKTLIGNSRLKAYRKYIELAKSEGYNVCSMKSFYEGRKNKNEKHFVMRHDVDYITSGTQKMFEMEKRCGIRSTYYFRFCTMDIPLIKEMISSGFEVGLHYETLSDYARQNRCSNINETDISTAREILKNEIIKFNNMIGYNMTSCVGHGAPENIKLNYSNNILLEGQNMKDYGIIFEAYDKELYEKYVDCHIMDANIRRNFGFSYNENPIDAMLSQKRNIVFLAHPHHWYLTWRERLANMAALVLGKVEHSANRSFQRIAGIRNQEN